jgi:electron transport complex protein RnfA
MGIYLALITTNCAILAVTFDVISGGYTFIQAIVYALGAALGFLLSLVLLAGIRDRLRSSEVPPFLKGTPILFVTAALLSMSFTGFSGLVK